MKEGEFVILTCIHALAVNAHERGCFVVKKDRKPEIYVQQAKKLIHRDVFLRLCSDAPFAKCIEGGLTVLLCWMYDHNIGFRRCRKSSNQPIGQTLTRGGVLRCDGIIFHYLSPAEKVLVTLIEGGEKKSTGALENDCVLSRSCYIFEPQAVM